MLFALMKRAFRPCGNPSLKALIALLLFCGLHLAILAAPARAQDGPETGGKEETFWISGGHGTNGRTQHTTVFHAGFRYGWVLTAPHGPSFLRGRFEYAVDLAPVNVFIQRTNTAYGIAANPLGLVWNFEKRGRVVPYLGVDGGLLLTNLAVPTGTGHFNFTSGGGIGMHILTGKLTWTADLHFVHTSNDNLVYPNPGMNTVQLRLGIGWFKHPRK
jgi:hypothetical protein